MATNNIYKKALDWTLIILVLAAMGIGLWLLREIPMLLIIIFFLTLPLAFLVYKNYDEINQDGRGMKVSSIISGFGGISFFLAILIGSSHGKFESIFIQNLISGHTKQQDITLENENGQEYEDTGYYFVADTKSDQHKADIIADFFNISLFVFPILTFLILRNATKLDTANPKVQRYSRDD